MAFEGMVEIKRYIAVLLCLILNNIFSLWQVEAEMETNIQRSMTL